MQTNDRTLFATLLICGYAAVIGYTDNYVRVIAQDISLFQFHAIRAAMALPLLFAFVVAFRRPLRPQSFRRVAARSGIHGTAMLIYFGALERLPVAVVAAGLFTAPIFVLLISRFVYGRKIGPVRILAVVIGFIGVICVLGPRALGEASVAAVLPVLAGLLYAIGNMATREWCPTESAETLLAGFFATLGIMGCVGMGVLWILQPDIPPEATGFLLRQPVSPQLITLWWVLVQAVGSLIGVGLMIRAYQVTDASRASVIEYVILPASAVWSYLIWGETLDVMATVGMALIIVAGAMISLRAKAREQSVAA